MQTQIQGEELRVTGKSRDDLQGAMALVRGGNLGQPFQFKTSAINPSVACRTTIQRAARDPAPAPLY